MMRTDGGEGVAVEEGERHVVDLLVVRDELRLHVAVHDARAATSRAARLPASRERHLCDRLASFDAYGHGEQRTTTRT